MDIEKEAREIEEELENEIQEEESTFSKISKVTISVILVILIITYILVDPNVRTVIAGFFESSTVDENTFLYEDKKITFEGETFPALVNLFKENQEAEFKACLTGEVSGKNYNIKKIFLPKIYSQTVFRVTSSVCPEETIITLHSHPYQKCVASLQDMNTLQSYKERNPNILLAVMCTEDRISFYG